MNEDEATKRAVMSEARRHLHPAEERARLDSLGVEENESRPDLQLVRDDE